MLADLDAGVLVGLPHRGNLAVEVSGGQPRERHGMVDPGVIPAVVRRADVEQPRDRAVLPTLHCRGGTSRGQPGGTAARRGLLFSPTAPSCPAGPDIAHLPVRQARERRCAPSQDGEGAHRGLQ